MPLPDPWSASGAETGKLFLKTKARPVATLLCPREFLPGCEAGSHSKRVCRQARPQPALQLEEREGSGDL